MPRRPAGVITLASSLTWHREDSQMLWSCRHARLLPGFYAASFVWVLLTHGFLLPYGVGEDVGSTVTSSTFLVKLKEHLVTLQL